MDKVIILASRNELSYLLINHLAEQFAIACVVFEAPHVGKLLRYRLKKLGAWTVAGQLVFLVWDRLVIRRRSRQQIERLLAGHDIRPPDGRLPVMEVESVNGVEVEHLLRDQQPKVVIVTGTGIIARQVLALAPIFINIHTGITPRYRGVHGAFWAVYEGRPELAGTTIHKIDAGVDTGAIIAQMPITIDPGSDTYRTLPVKQYLAALDALVQAVRAALDDRLTTYSRADLDSRQWFSPTPGEYIRFLRRLQALRK